MPRSPSRKTLSNSPLAPKYGSSVNGFPSLDVRNHFARSLSNLDRVDARQLRRFSNTIPARKAKRRIANGVLSMPWTIIPPPDQKDDEGAIAICQMIKQALQRPNAKEQRTYTQLVRSLIDDLLTLNVAAVERHDGDGIDRAFWCWAVDVTTIDENPDWQPHKSGLTPHYFQEFKEYGKKKVVPLMDEELFLIKYDVNTYESRAKSPLEVAYRLIQAFLGLGDFQNSTTTQAVKEYLIVLKGVTEQKHIDAFRNYWVTDVEGSGKIPIIGSPSGVDTVKVGARNDDELYLGYTEFILTMIALAFDLARRDFNLAEHDNRATATIAADTTFSDAILPMAGLLKEHINLDLVDFYYPGYVYYITDTERRSESEEAKTAIEVYQGGIATLNESRLRAGLDALPNGDRLLNSPEQQLIEPDDLSEENSRNSTKSDRPFL